MKGTGAPGGTSWGPDQSWSRISKLMQRPSIQFVVFSR